MGHLRKTDLMTRCFKGLAGNINRQTAGTRAIIIGIGLPAVIAQANFVCGGTRQPAQQAYKNEKGNPEETQYRLRINITGTKANMVYAILPLSSGHQFAIIQASVALFSCKKTAAVQPAVYIVLFLDLGALLA
jgi:hypothetical protein